MKAASDVRSVRQLAVSLRDARVVKGMTQAELAEMAGVSRPWISQFEQGKLRNASIDRIFTLCRILGVTPSVSYDVPDDMMTAAHDSVPNAEADRLHAGDDVSDDDVFERRSGIDSHAVDDSASTPVTERCDSLSFPLAEMKTLMSDANWQENLKKISEMSFPAIDLQSVSQMLQQWENAGSLFGDSYIQALRNLDLSNIAQMDISANHQRDIPESGNGGGELNQNLRF
ncbi:helix-turn-helix domain-containing protein [Bifidobacterium amazonense]|uniref:Helix-turn-helix domain-containing protein n=1 Tax=Bifidobacterium amazonense TaxID=2809027 RepID=A0ABS9VY63_9BIFI|nr:helix-turn-helix transcriptional regulator [Bifidobacterium amazonense]MCH9277003.1 helix-turn-helix domain-containing protein [Bifidobacterium amazonense]